MHPLIETLESKLEDSVMILESWANQNSGSENLPGLANMLTRIEKAFSILEADSAVVDLPSATHIDGAGNRVTQHFGKALMLKKHPEAKTQILLSGHYDTVFKADSPFQSTSRPDKTILKGPGVADMKGGLLIMLRALEVLEASDLSEKIGWEVLITPDEEIGSTASQELIKDRAKNKLFGLIFEPAFADGSLVSSRKGSANYTVVVRGTAAHSGRDFDKGRSAIAALAHFINRLDSFNDSSKGISINFGSISGGGPVNIVPDFAICRINLRANREEDMNQVELEMRRLADLSSTDPGLSLELHLTSRRTPKPLDKKTETLFEAIKQAGNDLNQDINWKPSGGVCDGNLLASVGLPCVDTLGAVGGNIHTHDEFIYISSLTERAALTASLLLKVAAGEIDLKEKFHV